MVVIEINQTFWGDEKLEMILTCNKVYSSTITWAMIEGAMKDSYEFHGKTTWIIKHWANIVLLKEGHL